jgi:hypothetical protein
MLLSEDILVDVLSTVGKSRLNWIGHISKMNCTKKISDIFNNNQQGSRLKRRQKIDG